VASDPLRGVGARGGAKKGAAPGTGVSDPRAARARELHAKAAEADRVAARYRAERDRLLHQLRDEDPKRWTYSALAVAVDCSRELIALVFRRSR
jgi:hypothetical protein